MTKITYFSDEDLQPYPSPVQRAIVNNHEDIGGYSAMRFLKDDKTVLFKVGDEWVACVPAEPNLN